MRTFVQIVFIVLIAVAASDNDPPALSETEFYYLPIGDDMNDIRSGFVQRFADHMVRSNDADRSGSLDAKEFVNALSVMQRGYEGGLYTSKTGWAFRMYDLDGDGSITKKEMLEIVGLMYKMVGNAWKMQEDEFTPEKWVGKSFRQFDRNKDGKLSRYEFGGLAATDYPLVRIIRPFNIMPSPTMFESWESK